MKKILFLQKMMKYEPSQRISAKTALTHSYFSGVANNRPVPYIKWTNTSQWLLSQQTTEEYLCFTHFIKWADSAMNGQQKSQLYTKVAIANSIKWSCVLTENVDFYHICFNQWNFEVSIKTICVYTGITMYF